MQCDIHDSFFLPHHGVWKKSTSSTNLRTILNGSSEIASANVSLNDFLHVGPNFLPNLSDQLCFWRQYKCVIEANVAKMYRQVSMHKDDHKFLVYGIKPSG